MNINTEIAPYPREYTPEEFPVRTIGIVTEGKYKDMFVVKTTDILIYLNSGINNSIGWDECSDNLKFTCKKIRELTKGDKLTITG